jgi:hypothetical protein
MDKDNEKEYTAGFEAGRSFARSYLEGLNSDMVASVAVQADSAGYSRAKAEFQAKIDELEIKIHVLKSELKSSEDIQAKLAQKLTDSMFEALELKIKHRTS